MCVICVKEGGGVILMSSVRSYNGVQEVSFLFSVLKTVGVTLSCSNVPDTHRLVKQSFLQLLNVASWVYTCGPCMCAARLIYWSNTHTHTLHFTLLQLVQQARSKSHLHYSFNALFSVKTAPERRSFISPVTVKAAVCCAVEFYSRYTKRFYE